MEAVPIPARTLVSKVFPRVDHADAYRMPAAGSAPDLARRMLTVRSRVGGGLLRIRDLLVSPFGIRPAHGRRGEVRIEPGASAGPFHVLEVTEEEVLFGEDDRHLDYCVSLLAQGGQATLSTVVRFHGLGGRAYFFLVRPSHRILARRLLAAASRGR